MYQQQQHAYYVPQQPMYHQPTYPVIHQSEVTDPAVALLPQHQHQQIQMPPNPTLNHAVTLPKRKHHVLKKIVLGVLIGLCCFCCFLPITSIVFGFGCLGGRHEQVILPTPQLPQNFTNFQIDVVDDLQVELYEGSSIQVKVNRRWKHEKPDTTLSVEGNTLYLKTVGSTSKCTRESTAVYIPSAMSSRINLNINTKGDVSVEGVSDYTGRSTSFASLSVLAGSADISIENIVARASCTIQSTSGDIRAKAVRCAQVMMTTVSGDVKVKSISANVTAPGETSVYLSSFSGDISASNIQTRGEVYVFAKSGDIDAEFFQPGAVKALCQSGDVDVTLHGFNGTFASQAVSGDISLRNNSKSFVVYTTKTKQFVSGYVNNKSQNVALDASTTSGDVKITFD